MSVFDKAILMTPAKIGGVQLRPFSPFHAAVLLEYRSWYLPECRREPSAGPDLPSFMETCFALRTCSSTRRTFHARIAPLYGVLQTFARMVIAVRFGCALPGFRRRYVRNIATLEAHVLNYTEFAEVAATRDGASCGRTGAPWPWYLASVAITDMPGLIGQTCGDGDMSGHVWDMSVIELCCHKAIIAERAGDLRILTGVLDDAAAAGARAGAGEMDAGIDAAHADGGLDNADA